MASNVYTGLDFFLNGTSANANGIYLQDEPEISEIVPNYEIVTIPGRNGALHIADGSYQPRTITLNCYAMQYDTDRDSGYYIGGEGVYAAMADIYTFLFPSPQVIQFLRIGYEDTFWKGVIINAGAIKARLKTLNAFQIVFEAEPYRYAYRGGEYVQVGM